MGYEALSCLDCATLFYSSRRNDSSTLFLMGSSFTVGQSDLRFKASQVGEYSSVEDPSICISRNVYTRAS